MKSKITENWAKGGNGHDGGSDGDGTGGGIYNLGTLRLDAITVIKKNHEVPIHP